MKKIKLDTDKTKNILFIGLIFILLFPQIQSILKIFDFKPLQWTFFQSEDIKFSKEGFFSSEYQNVKEEYLRTNFSCREFFIRLYNQQLYSLYAKTLVWKGGEFQFEFGKDRHLYLLRDINAYKGLDYIGIERIHDQVDKLKVISDSLKEKDIDLVVLLASGKASFYPEYFPEKFSTVENKITNYDTYKQKMIEKGINLFDACDWFNHMKNKKQNKYKLFLKTGFHWSSYGAYKTSDSLLNFLQTTTGKPFPSMKLVGGKVKWDPNAHDHDLLQTLNLFYYKQEDSLFYPKVARENAQFNNQKVLVISDSYYWAMNRFGLSKDYFAEGEFWYYFNSRYGENIPSNSMVNDCDIKHVVESHDVVLIIATLSNMKDFGFGFVDKYYDLLKNKKNN